MTAYRRARTTTLAISLSLAAGACGSSPSPSSPTPSPSTPAAHASPLEAPRRSEALVLAPGDVADLAAVPGTRGLAGGSIATPRGDEQLIVVIASTDEGARTSEPAGDALAWSLDSAGATTPATATASTPARPAPTLATRCSLAADAWRSVPVAPEAAPTGAAVKQGAKRTLHASSANGVEDIQVTAIAIGKHAVVWADTTPAHPAVLDAAFVSKFLSDFDDTILPRGRSVFGVESDLDGDGHIGLVFTPLTRQNGKGTVAFFDGCDLARWHDCPTSNAGEYLWLTPPNAIDPPYNTPNAMKEILAHELSHLIHFNRKVLRNKQSSWPDSEYLIEGVGGFAQDVVGLQAGNLYVTQAGLAGIARFSLADVLADRAPHDRSRDGVMRGGAYLFVRWLYDHAGGDTAKADGTIEGHGGPALLRALLDAPASVASALPGATKSAIGDLAVDFYTTLAMSNRDEAGGVAPTNPCFSYLATQLDPVTKKQRGADGFAKFHGAQLKGPATTDARSGTLRPGGAVFITVAAKPGAPSLDLTVTVDPKAASRVRVGRLR